MSTHFRNSSIKLCLTCNRFLVVLVKETRLSRRDRGMMMTAAPLLQVWNAPVEAGAVTGCVVLCCVVLTTTGPVWVCLSVCRPPHVCPPPPTPPSAPRVATTAPTPLS